MCCHALCAGEGLASLEKLESVASSGGERYGGGSRRPMSFAGGGEVMLGFWYWGDNRGSIGAGRCVCEVSKAAVNG